jgi:cell wall integrity and stress response component
MKTPSLIAGALVAASQFTGALGQNIRGEQKEIQVPVPGSLTVQGCWSSKGNMTDSEVEPAAVSSGSCNKWCLKEKFTVFALSGQMCYCGMVMPPADTLVKDNKKCKYECPGWPFEACGGIGNPTYYSVFNMGVNVNPANYEEEEEENEGGN